MMVNGTMIRVMIGMMIGRPSMRMRMWRLLGLGDDHKKQAKTNGKHFFHVELIS
jgi:hypothetical protein